MVCGKTWHGWWLWQSSFDKGVENLLAFEPIWIVIIFVPYFRARMSLCHHMGVQQCMINHVRYMQNCLKPLNIESAHGVWSSPFLIFVIVILPAAPRYIGLKQWDWDITEPFLHFSPSTRMGFGVPVKSWSHGDREETCIGPLYIQILFIWNYSIYSSFLCLESVNLFLMFDMVGIPIIT